MPAQRCQKDGKSGWRWGSAGKCYTGRGAKAKAEKQGAAIEAQMEKSKMSNPKLLTTIVNKALLDMGTSENLDEFNNAMRNAAREAHPTGEWIWIAQISPSKVVVSVNSQTSYSYFEHTWTIEDGTPKLGAEATEVVPKTEYKPKRG
jgi:acetyl-CoA carboxylase carboxyltransferase component